MELTELTRKQQVALVAVMEAVALADGVIAEGEQRDIAHLAGLLGDDNYRDLLDDADGMFPDEESLKVYLTTIENQTARERIYGTVMQGAMLSPTIHHSQSTMLAWLREAWHITVTDPTD